MRERTRSALRRGARHHAAEAGHPSPLVLLVDDEEDQRELMAEFVEREGFRVATAASGEEALEAIAEHRPSIVVMDLWMPGLDGWETTKRIKADAATKDIPVVIVSAHAIGEHLRRAREAGADAVIAKPCPPSTLVERLRALLAARQPVE